MNENKIALIELKKIFFIHKTCLTILVFVKEYNFTQMNDINRINRQKFFINAILW